MATQVQICNLALGHVGNSKTISAVTENSNEANVLNRFYGISVNETMRALYWPFLRKTAALGLVESNPTTEWSYSYRYPSDCLEAIRILSGTRNDTRQSRVPYQILSDSSGLLIYTDTQDAVLEYKKTEVTENLFPDDFSMALSFKLAFYIAPTLAKGDPYKLGDRAQQNYQRHIMMAAANAANEQQDEELPDSEFIRNRL